MTSSFLLQTALALTSLLTLRAAAAPVINELMYHPASSLGNPEDPAAEWIEIHNPDASNSVDVSGWKVAHGVSFTIPSPTAIPAGGFLVIAANLAKFQTDHPGFAGLLRGGWTGTLANDGEQVRLEDGQGGVIDDVSYADEGGWATRVRSAVSFGHQGWEWEALHDGAGRSLEKRRPLVKDSSGQAWAASTGDGGTPGAVNSTYSATGVFRFLDIRQKPEIPRSTDQIVIKFKIREDNDPPVTLSNNDWGVWWRSGGGAWQFATSPQPSPLTEDQVAVIGPFAHGAVIEYLIGWDSDPPGSFNGFPYWPAAARTSNPGVIPQTIGKVCNALFQVDDSFNPAADFTSSPNHPVYRLVMTEDERAELEQIGTTTGHEQSSATMNGTFISHDGTGIKLVHNAGIRNHGLTPGPPNNYLVSFRSDDRWNGRSTMLINCQYPHSQALGSALFTLAGVAPQNSTIVQVRVNGVDLAQSGAVMYGRYARLEGRGEEWTGAHYPNDAEGNLYRLDDNVPGAIGVPAGNLGSGEFRYEGNDPAAYSDTFIKETNQDANDFSDLANLTRIVSAPATGGTVDQPAIADSAWVAALGSVLDIDQVLRFMTADALIGNLEDGLQNGRAHNLSIYRGVSDPRFRFIPHALADIFDIGTSAENAVTRSIFSCDDVSGSVNAPGTGVLGLARLLSHPQLAPRYYAAVLNAVNTWFTPAALNPVIDQIMTGWVPSANGGATPPNDSIAEIKSFVTARRANVLAQIQQNYALSVTGNAADVNGMKQTTDGSAVFTGTFHVAKTYSITLNGTPATMFYRTQGADAAGTWRFTATPANGFLKRGVNHVTVNFHDGINGTGNILKSLTADVYYSGGAQTGITANGVPQIGSVGLLVPASYLPGVPFLVRVDVRDASGNFDRAKWNTTATLAATNGVALNPSTVTLYNGMGSALVAAGGGGGGTTTQTLLTYGTGGNGTAGSGTAGSTWKCKTDFTPAMLAAFITSSGATWKNEGFVMDASWVDRTTETGYGDNDENGPFTRVDFDTATAGTQSGPVYLFRNTFNITDSAAVTSVTGEVKFDDSCAVYVNGTQVFRHADLTASAPLTEYTETTTATTREDATAAITVPVALLHNGTNTIAVEVHQHDVDSSDVTFDLRLSASIATAGTDPGNFTLTATAAGLTNAKALTSLGTSPSMTTVSGTLPPGVTNWSGVINVTGDVTVPATGTLTIAPGTHILMAGTSGAGSTTGSDLIVTSGGTVNASGTLALPIHITAANPLTRWGEINTGGATTTWNYCLISRACHSPGGGHTGTGPCFRLANGAVWTFDDGVIADLSGKTLTNAGNTTMVMRRSQFARCVMGPETDGSGIIIEDCNFTDMLPVYRESGAADDEDNIYIHDSGGRAVNLRRSVFANSGDDGIDLLAGGVTVEDCIIRNIFDKGMSLLQNNVTVLRTQIIDCDFGISCKTQIGSEATAYTLTMENCTIVGEAHPTNQADQSGGVYWHNVGVHVRNKYGTGPNAQLVVNAKNCILSAITPMLNDYATAGVDFPLTTVSYNCYDDVAGTNPVDPAPPSGTGDITANPLFVSAAAKDFHPAAASPCRDSGDPASPPDADGSRIDRGALVYGTGSGGGTATNIIWALADSPFRITADVTIPTGATLNIQPGVTVLVDENRHILVNGKVNIAGTANQHITLRGVPGLPLKADPADPGLPLTAPKWGGLWIENSMNPDNIVSYVDFVDAQDMLSGSRGTSRGCIEVKNSEAIIDHCTFRGTHLHMIYLDFASVIIQHCTFPDMFAAGELPGALDNVAEHVKGINMWPANGHCIVRWNTFGGNKGHNDVLDIDSRSLPNPILQIRGNQFNGLFGDECLDLGGDVLLDGNIIRNGRKDQWNNSGGYGSGFSTGDAGGGTTIVVTRSIFADIDHGTALKTGTAAIFEYNTFYKLHPNFTDGQGRLQRAGVIAFVVPEEGTAPGDGAYMGNNIFWNLPVIFGQPDVGTGGTGTFPTRLQADYNLVDPATSTVVGANHPGGFFSLGVNNVTGDPMLADPDNGNFSLALNSPARGANLFGKDLGGMVPDGAWITGEPPAQTPSVSATLTIGGPGVFYYRWKLDDGPWSAAIAIDPANPLHFPRTSPTVRTAQLQLSSLAAGLHTVSVIGQDYAGVWQDEAAATVSKSWTVNPSLQLIVLNEIAASTADGIDWIELYNAGAAPLDLGGWSLTDEAAVPAKYAIPAGTIIASGGYLKIPSTTSALDLDNDGDTVWLFEGSTRRDSISFGSQPQGYTLNRTSIADGAPVWALGTPSPEAAELTVNLGTASTLRISEWLAANDVRFKSDWIELTNTGTLPVSLSGLSLTDNFPGNPSAHVFGPYSYVGPGGFAAFLADGHPSPGSNHLAFTLDAQQETIVLHSAGTVLDQVSFQPQTGDFSQSRDAGGAPVFYVLPTRGFTNGTGDPGYANALAILNSLRITEIMYHPVNGDNFEFIELTNTGAAVLDLGGVVFFDGIDFTFPPGFSLAAGAQTVLVRNPAAFESRYGIGVNVAGVYSGTLNNNGAQLALRLPNPWDANVLCFRYQSTWYGTNDSGLSLVLAGNGAPINEFDERSTWTTGPYGGTPAGATLPAHELASWLAENGLTMSDLLLDGDQDGLVNLVEYSLLTDPALANPGNGIDSVPTAQFSTLAGETVPALRVAIHTSSLPGGFGCPGIAYYIQDSADLVTWRNLLQKTPGDSTWQHFIGPLSLVEGLGVAGGRAQFILKSPNPISANGRRHVRMQVVLLP